MAQIDEKTQKLLDKTKTTAIKDTTKNAVDQVKAEIERIKSSDLSKAEQKAALTALKNVQQSIKAPF